MEGVAQDNQYGISYRTIQKIFHLLNLRSQQQRAAEMFMDSGGEDGAREQVSFDFEINLGMLEIYNEEIYDLLSAQGSSTAEKKIDAMRAGGKTSLEIRRDEEGRITVPNLTKERVNSIQEVMDLLKRGNSNRATAATDLNEHSSRSHMVLMVEVTSGIGGVSSNRGTLYLVDLAGSERVRKSKVSGDQLKEAGFINKSLSALGNVMEALDRKASHVPFRDSKLTYLLQDSLGGNSRTMMIVAICPNDQSYDESVHALQFATRVRRIRIGAAQRNIMSKNLEETVKSLTEEMRALTRAKERSETQLHTLKRDNARVQDKLKGLSTTRTQNKSDSKTLEMLRKNNDDMAARWQKEKAARESVADELENSRKEQRALQQQIGKMKSQISTLERKLDDKENELDAASKRLRQEHNVKAASTVRARRDEVLNSRSRLPAPSPRKSSVLSSTPGSRSVERAGRPSSPDTSGPDMDEIAKIRDQVLALLEKHDQGKVNRIDIIMEKFKGKEALLLEKMSQRYEGVSSAASFQKRNEIALQRHQERMRKIREKQKNGGSVSPGSTITE
jgi:kinesin family protein C2/C3